MAQMRSACCVLTASWCCQALIFHIFLASAFVDPETSQTRGVVVQPADADTLAGQPHPNTTVTVRDPWGLRRAMEDQNVAHILVASDLQLRKYNGWGGSNMMADSTDTITQINLSRNLTIETDPQRKAQAAIDLGLVNFLGSLVRPAPHVVVELKRLTLTNVPPPQRVVLPQDLGDSIFSVKESIVKLVVSRGQLQDVLWVQYPSKTYNNSDGAQTNVSVLPPGICQGGGLVSECHDGGWYVDTWDQSFDWDRFGSGGIRISHSLFPLEVLTYYWRQTSADIANILRQESAFIVIKPPTMNPIVELSCDDFQSQGNKFNVTGNFTMRGGSGPSAIAVDFNCSDDCVNIGLGHQIVIGDLMLIRSAKAGNLRRMLPFFNVSDGSVVKLENVVVSVADSSLKDYDLMDLQEEITNMAQTGDPDHRPNITVVAYSEFWDEQIIGWAHHQHATRGVLVDGMTVHVNGPNGSSNTAADVAGAFQIAHTFFVLERELPARYGKHYQSLHSVQSTDAKKRDSPISGGQWRTVLACLGAFLGIGTVVGAVFRLFEQRRQRHRQRLVQFTAEGTFMELHGSVGETNSRGSSGGTQTNSISGKELQQQEHQAVADKMLDALTLGPLIGRGSFGQVYKATWNGAPVAVKIICHRQSSVSAEADALREAMLSSNLRHPNVVQTFLQTTRDVLDRGHEEKKNVPPCGGPNGYLDIKKVVDNRTPLLERPSPPTGLSMRQKETWIVQEYCDMGSLAQAIQLQLLKPNGVVDMSAVLSTCLDICRGVQYLHYRSVIHGDLKCANVLLCSSTHHPGAFTAKVADFGLSRQLDMDVTHISTNTVGTLTHCPPELLKGRKLLPKADVYSFGIMMWEIVNGRSPFEGWTVPQLIRRVVTENWRPAFSAHTPQDYVKLAEQCWDADATNRPSFDDVLKRLEDIKGLVRDSP